MVTLLECSPISTEELCQSDHRVLGHLPDQGPSLPIVQFGQAASSRKTLGGFKLLSFKNGGHCVLRNLQCCRNIYVPFPRSVPLRNSFLGALWTFPSTSWLGFCSDIHCQLWDLYIDIQSIGFTTGRLQSSCRNISGMIN
jgi:hypothetical protein